MTVKMLILILLAFLADSYMADVNVQFVGPDGTVYKADSVNTDTVNHRLTINLVPVS